VAVDDRAAPPLQGRGDEPAPAVFIDLDTVLIAMHRGRRGLELGLQADIDEAIERLREVTQHVVVLVDPPPVEGSAGRETERRLAVLEDGLGDRLRSVLVVTCPHGERRSCACAKPDSGLIEVALTEHRLRRRGSWYIGGDQEGMQAARGSGLHTVRVGPLGEDHLDTVHRPDHEARDLLDAANRIMLQTLSAT
jgi:histidinol phosphatase-like enzyme